MGAYLGGVASKELPLSKNCSLKNLPPSSATDVFMRPWTPLALHLPH